MDLNKNHGVMSRALLVAQGLAVAALLAAPGIASATPMFVQAHIGLSHRFDHDFFSDTNPGGSTEGTGGDSNTHGFNPGTPTDDGGDPSHYTPTGYTPSNDNTDSNTGTDNTQWRNPGSDDPPTDCVPEPGSLALLLAGLAGLLFVQARRRVGSRDLQDASR